MIHPSYSDLMQVVNSSVEPGEQPIVQSRYSIVLATAKRARQIIDGDEPMVNAPANKKPLSVAVEELHNAELKILNEEEAARLAVEAKTVRDELMEEIKAEAEAEAAQAEAEAAEAEEAEEAEADEEEEETEE